MSSQRPRAISVPLLLGSVAVLGIALGTAGYWASAARDDARIEALMQQQTLRADPHRGMSVDLTAPPPAALVGIPPYPGAVPRRVAESMRGQGEAMAVAWFATPDPVDEVISFYELAFRAAKLIFVTHRYGERSAYIGWLQPDHTSASADAGLEMLEGVMHLVSVLREGHTTTVLLSASRPLALLGAGTRLPRGLLLPPWADPPQVFDLGEGPLTQTTIFSEVRGHGVEEIARWLRENLKPQGFEISDLATAAARSELDFRREKERLSVVLTPSGEKVTLMLQYSAQPLSLTDGL